MILYRPVGMHELRLIFENQLRAFPPRLPEQPFFYPVVNQAYAEQIARDWNTSSDPFAGYVTEFAVADDYLARFEKHIVGNRRHEEYWIPAEQLDEFNRQITPPIRIIQAFFGAEFRGSVPDQFGSKGRSAAEQFALLSGSLDYSPMDFGLEIVANRTAIFLNYPFWLTSDLTEHGIAKERQGQVLQAIQAIWAARWPELPLPTIKQWGA